VRLRAVPPQHAVTRRITALLPWSRPKNNPDCRLYPCIRSCPLFLSYFFVTLAPKPTLKTTKEMLQPGEAEEPMQTTEEWEDLGAFPTLLIAPLVESLFNAESNPRIISHCLRTATTITQFVRCLWVWERSSLSFATPRTCYASCRFFSRGSHLGFPRLELCSSRMLVPAAES
jgi:hypothetical protein